jgi:hypothetical protein
MQSSNITPLTVSDHEVKSAPWYAVVCSTHVSISHGIWPQLMPYGAGLERASTWPVHGCVNQGCLSLVPYGMFCPCLPVPLTLIIPPFLVIT